MGNISVEYGGGEISAVLPGDGFLGILRPKPLSEIPDLNSAVLNSLRRPSGTEPLAGLVRGAGSVVIVISDQTRVLPSGLLLPTVIGEMEEAGVKREQITVVIGVGNHRPTEEAEKKRLMGELWGLVKCLHSKERGYVRLGITKRGTPVEVAAPVAEAGLVMALGTIEMHQLAGFSGGVKAVAAGTASPLALEHNHRLSTLRESGLGLLEGNIVRQDMEEFAGIARLKFILNVVLNEKQKAVAIEAGDPVLAHRKGCETALALYSVPLARRAGIVIVSPGGYPRDTTVYQVQKSLRNALRAVVDGGIVIVAAQCREGFGDPVFEQWLSQASGPGDIEERTRLSFVLGGHKAAFIAQAARKARVFWVSDMKPGDVRRLFFEPYSTLQEAVDAAVQLQGSEAGVLVMPWGALTVPCVGE